MNKTHEFYAEHPSSYPHVGGCEGCRAGALCSVCGEDIRSLVARCTNGHCMFCHASVCSPGGITTPGHGMGTREKRLAGYQEQEKLRVMKQTRSTA